MAELTRRLARLERLAGDLLPDPRHCPCCRGGVATAFSDEPDNAITPYYPHDRCPVCGGSPQGVEVLTVPAEFAELFTGIPWSDEPLHRVLEKTLLLQALAARDGHDAEQLVRLIFERACEHTARGVTNG